ncbi:MAG: DUF4381 domain-containing protein [Bradyrhizobium sp.]|nr:DUF4381 domain-containing protein [Bradyrhizobium sp.]
MAETQPAPSDPLAGLIDIPLPPEVSLWPQTWTSRIAIALLVAAAVVAIWHLVHSWRANRYRREALFELDEIGQRLDAGEVRGERLAELSMLVRRTALAAFPRESVAPLAGPAWLAFLDRSYGGRGFSQGAGRLLASAPYQRAAPDQAQLRALAALVRQWIRGHHA